MKLLFFLIDKYYKEGYHVPFLLERYNEQIKKLCEIIKSGLNINLPNKKGETLLNKVANKGDVDLTKLLIEKGADENNLPKDMALIFACEKGDFNKAKSLIEEGANVNFKTLYENQTPLIFAIYSSSKIVKLLIENGTDVNISYNIPGFFDRNLDLYRKEITKITPLLTACKDNNLETVKILLKHGAKVNKKDSNKDTALSLAKENNNTEMVELLKSYGAKE